MIAPSGPRATVTSVWQVAQSSDCWTCGACSCSNPVTECMIRLRPGSGAKVPKARRRPLASGEATVEVAVEALARCRVVRRRSGGRPCTTRRRGPGLPAHRPLPRRPARTPARVRRPPARPSVRPAYGMPRTRPGSQRRSRDGRASLCARWRARRDLARSSPSSIRASWRRSTRLPQLGATRLLWQARHSPDTANIEGLTGTG